MSFSVYRIFSLGRYHTDLSMKSIILRPTEHCYAPSIDAIPVLQLKNKIKTRAAETKEPPSTILHSIMRYFPLDSAIQLARNETLLQTIRR